MPIFEYKAFSSSGKTVSGMIDADSAKTARGKLRKQGVYITDLKEDKKGRVIKAGGSSISIFTKVKIQDISLMTRQMSTLISAGMPVVDSLTTLTEQIENPVLRKIITNIRESVNEGSSLADALESYPKYFSNIYINMIRAGEEGGALDLVLLRLAELMEKQVALKNKMIAALAYPVIMIIVGSTILLFLLAYVVPVVTKKFLESNAALPMPTEILIVISNIVQNWWWLLFILLGCFIFFLKKYTETVTGRYFIDNFKLKIPVFGNMIKKVAISRFSRTLGLLLQSGIPILRAFDIVSAIIDNKIISEAIKNTRTNIKEGEDIASQLKVSGLFPPIVINLIAVGEKSGNLDVMLLKISETYEGEVENSVQALTSLIEPLMIVVMGIAVGFIVLAILLPIFEMNNLVK